MKARTLLSTLAAAALLAAGQVASAQRVAGTISLAGGARGAGGILLVARDSSGTDLARAITSDQGRYAITLPRPGAVKLSLVRVGFVDQTILNRVVAANEVVTLDTIAIGSFKLLPPRGGSTPSSCGEDAQGKQYVDSVLVEARKMLLALQLGLSRPGVVSRWASIDYRLAANGSDTARFSIARHSGSLLGAFGSPVLAELQRSGYVVTAGTDRLFRGLDVPALLSDWFGQAYCFTAIDRGAASLTLEFTPKDRRRDYVDITGSMTFTRATLELVRVEYLYVGLRADEDKRGAGGRLAFSRTEGGSWLLTDWSIQFPAIGMIELETFRANDRGRLLQPEVIGHEILGGRTTAVLEGTRAIYSIPASSAPAAPALRAVCYESVLAAPTGAARGRLTSDGRPVSGSRIRATWRVGVDIGGEVPLWRDEIRETTTSNRGDWVLCDLPAGVGVELSWEIMGRRSTAPLRVAAGAVVDVGPDGRIER